MLRVKILRGEIVAVVLPKQIAEVFGRAGVTVLTHDQLRSFMEAKASPQRAVKRYVEALRKHAEVQHVLRFMYALKEEGLLPYIGPMGYYDDSSIGLVAAILGADAVSDSIIILAKLVVNGKMGYDAASYTNAKETGLIEVHDLMGGVALAYPRRGGNTLPSLVGIEEKLENLPERLRNNILKGNYRGKGNYGTDTAYIKIVGGLQLYGFKPHRDPAIIEVEGEPRFIIYGDYLNGLATVIRGIMSGKISKVAYFDIIREKRVQRKQVQ